MSLRSRINAGSSPPVLANKSTVRSLWQVNLSRLDMLLMRVKLSSDRWCSTWLYYQFSQPVFSCLPGSPSSSFITPTCSWDADTQEPKTSKPWVLLQNAFGGITCLSYQVHALSIIPATAHHGRAEETGPSFSSPTCKNSRWLSQVLTTMKHLKNIQLTKYWETSRGEHQRNFKWMLSPAPLHPIN